MSVALHPVVVASTEGLSREEWRALHRHGIGSSDAPAVAGVDPYRSPLAVYLAKRGEGLPDEDSEAAYWGRKLEAIVAEEVSQRLGLRLDTVNAILRHPEFDWMRAEPDRVSEDGRVVEIKTTGAWNASEWANNRVPDRVMVQVQHQLAVTGAPAAIVAVLIGGQRLEIREVARDEDLIQSLIHIEHRFWYGNVLAGVPPEPDGSEAAERLLRRLYPEAAEGRSVLLDLEAEDKLNALLDAQAELAEAQRRVEELRQWFMHRLGEAEYGIIRGIPRVRWQTVRQARLDTKALERDHPELVEQYRTESVYRRFSVLNVEEV